MQWFDLETKCQKLVYEIMQPTVVQQQNDKDHINKIQKALDDDIYKRIEMIEFFILKKKKGEPGYPTVIDELNARIDKSDSQITEMNENLHVRIDSLDQAQKLASNRVEKIQERSDINV